MNAPVIAALMLLAVSACKLEAGDAIEPSAPSVGSPESTPPPGCEARHPMFCADGYYREWTDDPTVIWCMHIAVCPVAERPCVQGETEGDPREFVQCGGRKP